MIASPRSAPRSTQWLLAFLALGVWGLLVRPYLPLPVAEAKTLSPQQPTTFDTLTVQRINIVDANGKTRLIIANSARFPDVEIRGKVLKRSIHDAAGLVFYDVNGQETGVEVLDRSPYDPGNESSQGIRRIALLDEDDNAQLVISDPQGHPRIRIGVDTTGTPAITMLNSDGKEVYSAGK